MATKIITGTLTTIIDLDAAPMKRKQRKVSDGFKAMEKQGRASSQALKTALRGAAVAGAVLVAGIVSTTKAFARQEDAVAKLNQTLKVTKNVAGFTSKELQANASALQDVTTFSDDAIISVQSLLATFTNIRGDRFTRATEAVLDLSTAMKVDARSASIQLGKALNDPVRGVTALADAGISFSDSQRKMIKEMVDAGRIVEAQTLILKELESQGIGGVARAMAKTTSGEIKQAINAWGLLEKAIGGVVAKSLGFGDASTSAKNSIQELTKFVNDSADEWSKTIREIPGEIQKAFDNKPLLIKVIAVAERASEEGTGPAGLGFGRSREEVFKRLTKDQRERFSKLFIGDSLIPSIAGVLSNPKEVINLLRTQRLPTPSPTPPSPVSAIPTKAELEQARSKGAVDFLGEGQKALEELKKDARERRLKSIREDIAFEKFRESVSNFDSGAVVDRIRALQQEDANQIMRPEAEEALSGAFLQGSIEAARIINQVSTNRPEDKTAKNTKEIAELMQELFDNGISLNDVGLATAS